MLQCLCEWLGKWRFVWKEHHDKTRDYFVGMAVNAQKDNESKIRKLCEAHYRELAECADHLAKIADRCSEIVWRRDGERYAVTVMFDPRLAGYGSAPREELEYLARYFGRRVESEIATSKFVHKAHDTERRERCEMRVRPRHPTAF